MRVMERRDRDDSWRFERLPFVRANERIMGKRGLKGD